MEPPRTIDVGVRLWSPTADRITSSNLHAFREAAEARAGRPLPGSVVEAIYGFEVLSATGWVAPSPKNAFIPAHFVDIGNFYAAKQSALKAYDAEMRPFPHARSFEAVEALAVLRGAQAGLKRAEGFTVLRSIVR